MLRFALYVPWWLVTVTNAGQKRFTDAVNGKSGLNYWDALESEVRLCVRPGERTER